MQILQLKETITEIKNLIHGVRKHVNKLVNWRVSQKKLSRLKYRKKVRKYGNECMSMRHGEKVS